MKKTPLTSKLFFYSLLILLFFCQCKKDTTALKSQIAYFEINYENYAWGYDFDGLFIDSEGRVLTYNNPENPWSLYELEEQVSESDLLDNMAQATYSELTISAEALEDAIEEIPSLDTNFSKEKNVGADIGRITVWAYRIEDNGNYQRIMLKLCGDFTQKNKHKTAKKLVRWLKNNLEDYSGC